MSKTDPLDPAEGLRDLYAEMERLRAIERAAQTMEFAYTFARNQAIMRVGNGAANQQAVFDASIALRAALEGSRE